jgi:hypothetical protein
VKNAGPKSRLKGLNNHSEEQGSGLGSTVCYIRNYPVFLQPSSQSHQNENLSLHDMDLSESSPLFVTLEKKENKL